MVNPPSRVANWVVPAAFWTMKNPFPEIPRLVLTPVVESEPWTKFWFVAATWTPAPEKVSAKLVDEPLKAVVFMFAMSLATVSRPVVKL